jgi:hypothetical protein
VKTLLGVTALVVAAGAVGYFAAGWGSDKAVSLGPPPGRTTVTQASQGTSLPSGRGLEVWFARDGRLVETLRAHRATQAVATVALHELLAGPTRAERATGMRTEIPRGTRLLGLVIANGVARVDFSSDYQGGSSRSLQLRLAQVVYTLTQFPTVRSVRFSVDGSPVNAQPAGRATYKALAASASALAGSWKLLPRAPIGPQTMPTGVWTGRELLVLGSTAAAAYNPQRVAWRKLGSRLAGRYRAVVSTGRELLAWGRSGGAAYSLDLRRLRRLPNAPFIGSAAWTGREVIMVSGSRAAAYVQEKGWRELPRLPEARPGAGAVWDGSELLVVGGNDAPTQGFAYDPKANRWRRLAPMDSGRAHAAAVWTGTRLLVWGGETGRPGGFVTPPHGLAYDPRADRWSPLPQAPLRGRVGPIAVWTGRAMIVWGGAGLADGAAFSPEG